MSSRVVERSTLILALTVTACGGSDSPSGPPAGPPTPPAATTARITIDQATTVPTIYAGTVWYRSGKTLGSLTAFTAQSNKCSASPVPHSCFFDVPIGDSVVFAAQDQLAEPDIGNWATAVSPDDPRTIQSQFVNWGGACTVPQRGYCVLKANANVTISAQYKPLTLTRFLFSGLNTWGLTILAPPVLDPAGLGPGGPQKVVRAYGAGIFVIDNPPQHPRCIGEAPGVRCVYTLTADNATIKFEAFPPGVTPPLGSPGPLAFVGWSGACSGAPSPTGPSACNLTSGVDQTATVRWEYYRCVSTSQTTFASEGTSGWKLPASVATLAGCTLTQ